MHFPFPESLGMTIFNTAINSVVKLSHYKANSAFVLIAPMDWNIGHMVEGDGYREKRNVVTNCIPPKHAPSRKIFRYNCLLIKDK